MKTIIVEQLISHDANGLPKGMLIKQATFDDEGKLVSTQDVGLTVLSSAAIAAINAEKTELQQDLATATTQLEVTTQAKTQLITQVATLRSQVSTLQSQLTELPTLQTQLAEALELVEEYRPFNNRILKGKAFYKRVTQEDMETLLASDFPQLVLAGKTIRAYRDNDWRVELDSVEFQTLVQGVLQAGVFDEADVAAIMRDATKDEAYVTT